MNKRIRRGLAALAVLGLAVLVGAHAYLDHWAKRPVPVADTFVFEVVPNAPFAAVAETLAERGAVHPRLFRLRAWQRGLLTSLKRGEYRVVVGHTPDELLDRLVRGDVVQHPFLIVEGSTSRDLLRVLETDDRIHFDLAGATVDDVMARLGFDDGHAEGRFFPDTYHFTRGATASGLLRQAKAKMDAELAQAWSTRASDLPLKSPDDALILASIIEKETAHAPDRRRVAGVFTRRLRIDMRLQSDPTVIYGLGDGFGGDLTRAMLKADGPYNTYRNKGLPPTPIALPGRAAIDAALSPADGSAMYFVARGDGTSEFSATLEDHNRAVRRYQRR